MIAIAYLTDVTPVDRNLWDQYESPAYIRRTTPYIRRNPLTGKLYAIPPSRLKDHLRQLFETKTEKAGREFEAGVERRENADNRRSRRGLAARTKRLTSVADIEEKQP